MSNGNLFVHASTQPYLKCKAVLKILLKAPQVFCCLFDHLDTHVACRECDSECDAGQKRLCFSEKAASLSSSGAGRHSYFHARRLQRVLVF